MNGNFRKTCASAAVLSLAAAGAASAQISDDVVRIGVLTDKSGVYSAVGGAGAVIAAEMAVEDFGGEVAGAPIEVVSADHQNKPDIAASTAREWIDRDGVDVITEMLNSGVGLAVQNLASNREVITINTGAGSTQLTNEECTEYGIHYVYDTHSMAVGTGGAIVEGGGDTWFFISADYAFGESLEANTTAQLEAMGGEVVGGVKHPLSTADFSSYLLQAQNSGAEVIGLANAGGDFTNAVKQANEFGIVEGGQALAGLLVFLTDVKSLGLPVAQGLEFTTAWYWDQDEESREFAERFLERHGTMPTMVHAGLYSAITNYLKAIDEAGTDAGPEVRQVLGEMEIDDFFAQGEIREDGRFVHDMFLVQAKTPEESEGEWDLVKVTSRIPADEAFIPLSESKCSLVQ